VITSQDLAERGQNEVARALLVKRLRDEAKMRKMEDERAKARAQIASFEYDRVPEDEDDAGDDDAVDWFRGDKVMTSSRTPSPRRHRPPSPFRGVTNNRGGLTQRNHGQGSGGESDEGDDDEGDEQAFRQTMSKLRNRLTHDSELTRSRRSVSPKHSRHARTLECGSHESDKQKQNQPLSLRRVARDASGHEILEVVKLAVHEYAQKLRKQARHDTQDLQFEEDSLDADAMSAFGASGVDMSKERDLKRVYTSFSSLRNRKRGHHTSQLTRLKFHGALRVLLNLDLDWPQFDRVFALITPPHGDGTDGSVQWEEFRDAMWKGKGVVNQTTLTPRPPSTKRSGGLATSGSRR
jgi:hypothetical protein